MLSVEICLFWPGQLPKQISLFILIGLSHISCHVRWGITWNWGLIWDLNPGSEWDSYL